MKPRAPGAAWRAGAVLAGTAAALLWLGATAAHDGRTHDATPAADAGGAAAPLPLAIDGSFDLVDHQGRRRTDADFRGRYLLVYFGYASCPGMCPLSLARLAEAVDLLGPVGDRVQPLFISVDPARDTPKQLAKFVASIHPRLIGLTGTEAATAAAAKAYGVTARPVARGADGGTIFGHGQFTYLMAPDGRFLTLLPPVLDADAMAGTIRRYLD